MKVEIRIGDIWEHHNGKRYVILMVANLNSKSTDYPITIVYRQELGGNIYSKDLNNFLITMTRIVN